MQPEAGPVAVRAMLVGLSSPDSVNCLRGAALGAAIGHVVERGNVAPEAAHHRLAKFACDTKADAGARR